MTIHPELAAAVQHVLPAVSRDRKHAAALRCVLVERTGDVVRVVATDTHRLVVCERAGELLPPGTRLLLDPATLEAAPGVSADEFPAYERLLAAADDAATATIDAAELVDAVEREADDGPIRLGIVDGRVVVGHGLVHADPDLVRDAAVAAGPGPISVEIAGEVAPIAFRSLGRADLVLLMPVRVAASRS